MSQPTAAPADVFVEDVFVMLMTAATAATVVGLSWKRVVDDDVYASLITIMLISL